MAKARNISGARHYEPFLFLMIITILVVTGFQFYWLRNTYNREKRTMQIKANVSFQETMRHLQAVNLKLKEPNEFDSTHKGKVRLIIDGDMGQSDVDINATRQREIVTMVTAMRDKLKDSAGTGGLNSSVVISMKKGGMHPDSLSPMIHRGNADDRFLQFLYRIDSLQDTIRIPEITVAYQQRIKEENLPIPFTVIRTNQVSHDDEGPGFSDFTVGFANPVTYHLQLGNTFPYLMKRIALPILFSIFLVGVTIVSFVLLYRNLIRQQRLAALKNEFIGNITHELKTPIATVGVAIEALKSFNAMQDPMRTKEYLDISSNELQRLNLLVDKVLKLSMFEKKEIDLKYEKMNLRDLVDEVVTSMRLQIEKYNARVSVSQHGDTALEADRLHLLSVVFNLLDNALKYSKGDGLIEIELRGKDQQVELSVADNGIGIAPEYKNKIFDKFFRVPTGNTHNARGYGLGLSYVAHVIEKHRGQITVESKKDDGTKFTITLPRNNHS